MDDKKLIRLLEDLVYWLEYQPVNNMGNWSKQTRIMSLKSRIHNLKNGIEDDEEDLTIDDLTEN